MKRYSLFYFVGQALKNLWRNSVMTFASIMVLLSCLVVMGGFALLVSNINYNLEKLALLNEIVVFLEYELPEEQVESVEISIKELDNVGSVTRITKDQAMEDMRDMFSEYSDLFDEEEESWLAESFLVTYLDNSEVSTLTYLLGQIEGVRKVRNRLDLAIQLESIKNGVTLVFVWFLVVLFVVSIFVIINTIKLAVFSRRGEIAIMRYIGATDSFIITPFIIEGVIIGFISSVAAFGVELLMYDRIILMIQNNATMIEIMPIADVRMLILYGFLGIGMLTGIIGSSISLGRYLKA